MGSVLTPPRSATPRPSRRTALIIVATLAVAAALLAAAQSRTPSGQHIRRVTIVNPTPYHLEVEVRGVDHTHGVMLGALGRQQTRGFDDVFDQGREWIFHFSLGSDDGGELRISREQLAGDHWTVTVPDTVAQRLAAAGLPPSPPE
ncbi:MAG TPA: hypothetical protein VGP90_02515 [Acidimicrobiia bacterium]|nr:hypothetical protein [Acidimicrobiia bacterium]